MGMKKGAVETSALVGLVSVLLIGFILFVFIKNSAMTNVNITAKETCKMSVQEYAKAKLPGVDLARTDTIKCPTRSVVINSGKDDTAKKGIANAMFDCFDQFGAGELELFDTRRASVDHYCMVCSKVTFTDKNKKISGLADYLTTTTVPGKRATYYEFLKGGSSSEAEIKTTKEVALFDEVDASKQYAVIFTYAKATGWWDKISAGTIAGTAGLVVGGAVSGFFTGGIGWVVTGAALAGGAGFGVAVVKAPALESEWQAGVAFLPYDSLKGQLSCSEIPIKQ